jgi:hypothetical protein
MSLRSVQAKLEGPYLKNKMHSKRARVAGQMAERLPSVRPWVHSLAPG